MRRPPPAVASASPTSGSPTTRCLRPEPNLGGAAIALDAVDEVEPVVPGGDAPVDPGDRLDVAAAVGRLDVRHSIERLHRRQPSRHRAHEQHLRPTVARDPQRRVPSLRGRAAAARERGGETARARARLTAERWSGLRPSVSPGRARGAGRRTRPPPASALRLHRASVDVQRRAERRRLRPCVARE